MFPIECPSREPVGAPEWRSTLAASIRHDRRAAYDAENATDYKDQESHYRRFGEDGLLVRTGDCLAISAGNPVKAVMKKRYALNLTGLESTSLSVHRSRHEALPSPVSVTEPLLEQRLSDQFLARLLLNLHVEAGRYVDVVEQR